MYFVNEIEDERFDPWIENFVNQVVRRSKFNGKGTRVRIKMFAPDYNGGGTVYISIGKNDKEEDYYIMANGFPMEFSVLTMNDLLVNYRLIDDSYKILKEGKIRIQCK